MSEVFLNIVNMSVSGAWIVLAVVLLRFLLKRAPRWVTLLLWAVVAVRLVIPFSFESSLSLMPTGEAVSPEILSGETPEIHTGLLSLNTFVNPIIVESHAAAPEKSTESIITWTSALSVIWVLGMAAMLAYFAVSYLRLRARVKTAVRLRDNIFESENVPFPFVLGLVRPKIYLPCALGDGERELVVSHEKAHLKRLDHIWKPLGFLLLTLHWFNPLLWMGYALLCRDIELACDERVIKKLGHDGRADYSEALLSCSINRKAIAACPLAFGAVGVKERVKNVLNYKKPAFWVIAFAVLAVIITAVCLLTSPMQGEKNEDTTAVTEAPYTEPVETEPVLELTTEHIEKIETLRKNYPEYFDLPTENGLTVYVWQMAPSAYYCGLLPTRETGYSIMETMMLKSVSMKEMKMIVLSYFSEISKDDISVILTDNPVSSYLYFTGEEESKAVEDMFWKTQPELD